MNYLATYILIGLAIGTLLSFIQSLVHADWPDKKSYIVFWVLFAVGWPIMSVWIITVFAEVYNKNKERR